MRHFECKTEKSNKFWRIFRLNLRVVTKYGRIGTHGQSSEKDFVSESQAEAYIKKKINEKLAKGYIEVPAGKTASKELDLPTVFKIVKDDPGLPLNWENVKETLSSQEAAIYEKTICPITIKHRQAIANNFKTLGALPETWIFYRYISLLYLLQTKPNAVLIEQITSALETLSPQVFDGESAKSAAAKVLVKKFTELSNITSVRCKTFALKLASQTKKKLLEEKMIGSCGESRKRARLIAMSLDED